MKIEDVVCQRMQFATTKEFSQKEWHFAKKHVKSIWSKSYYGGNVFTSMFELLGTENQDMYEHPETWWDAFKQRFFPLWLLRFGPVTLTRIYTKKVYLCPHPPIKLKDSDLSPHFQFLKLGEK